MKNITRIQNKLQMIIVAISIICFFVILFDFKRATISYLWVLPLSFAITNFFSYDLYSKIPENIGLTIIIILLFFRFTITPLLLILGNYTQVMEISYSLYAIKAILLIVYEMLALYFVLTLLIKKTKSYIEFPTRNTVTCNQVKSAYTIIVMILVFLWIATMIVAPEQKFFYRTIFGIGEVNYTAMETTQIISIYGTTFLKKGAMVLGNYLFKVIRIVLPGLFIIGITKYVKNKKISIILCLIVCATQFLAVDGAIARSIYLFLVLLLLTVYIHELDLLKFIGIAILLSSILVIIYFSIRYKTDINGYDNFFAYLSNIANAYFSGVSNVAAIFNLPRTLDLRLHYFLYDYLKAVPFSNTIFNLNDNVLDVLFNQSNDTTGQIPSTIGAGYYYFGYLLSPIYSLIFAIIAYKASEKLNSDNNPISMLNCLFISIIIPLGIVMYNHSIIILNIITIILPMVIIKRIAYAKRRSNIS